MRTSSLRGLGATFNVFAIESSMDELAERAGEDPVAYRLSILPDARARAVIEHVAHMSAWQSGLASGTGRGRGIGFARYKNMAAYAAVVAEVEVDEEVRLTQVWCACDAGLVINPDGAINQLEGGIIQAASWALKEGVRLDSNGISSRDWEGYPVLRFTEIPEITVELVSAGIDLPPLGVGEASRRPDRCGDRQCGRARTRRASARPAANARARHGCVAQIVGRQIGRATPIFKRGRIGAAIGSARRCPAIPRNYRRRARPLAAPSAVSTISANSRNLPRISASLNGA